MKEEETRKGNIVENLLSQEDGDTIGLPEKRHDFTGGCEKPKQIENRT